MKYKNIYLASASPRRCELLHQLGVAFALLLPDAQEDAEALEQPLPREAALHYVRRVCLAKHAAAGQRLAARGLPPAPLLCADTTVTLGGQLLGKPADARDATRMLRLLSGARHRVLTAVAVGLPGKPSCVVTQSQVQFVALTERDIAAYVKSGEPLGKAGAYAIQGRAGAFVQRISGSYSGIVGLPLAETWALLRAAGVQLGD
ncbi:MAG: septum formation inhibitor Maf [Betaproteobacteria bacterium]|nr:septum formation inhibitor Maf [Betaproteobacteria bacterium]MDE2046904.1 septum formation inhibitor Maf [Betaproteobacteria bacterium]